MRDSSLWGDLVPVRGVGWRTKDPFILIKGQSFLWKIQDLNTFKLAELTLYYTGHKNR